MMRQGAMRSGWLLAVVLVSGLIASHAAAGPQPVDRPLTITASEGLFAVTFSSDEVTALAIGKKSQKRAVKAVNRWVAGLVTQTLTDEFPVRRPARVRKRLAKLYSALLNRQQSSREGALGPAGSAPRLNALTLAAGVSVAGMTLDEALAMEFTLSGVSYDVSLDNQTTYAAGDGVTLQIDYSTPPAQGELNGSVFAALVRDASAPGVGLLIVSVFDSALPGVLSGFGATNSTGSDVALSITYDLQLTGGTSGVHLADDQSFDVLYFSREDVLGIGVPTELAEAAEALVAGAE